MKAGLATSVAAHVLVLGWGLVSLSSPANFNAEMTEALPVSLVPIGEEMSVKKGDLTAPKTEKPAPKPTTKPVEKPDAEHVGDGKVDNEAPLKPKEKDRDVDVTPTPAGDPKAKPMLVPPAKVTDSKPNETPKPDDMVKVDEPAKQEESAKPDKAEPKPAETANATEPAAEPAKDPMPVLPEKAPVPTAKPKPVAAKPPEKPKGEESVDDILAMNEKALIDKTRTSGGGAARSEGPAAFGGQKNIGNNQQLMQTFGNIVATCIKSRFDAIAIGGGTTSDLKIQAHFFLNVDGTLDGTPELSATGGDNRQQEIGINQARAAIAKCSPYPLPADKHGMWREINMVFDPLGEMR